ncbi:MAG: hypothetical protein II961_08055 [Candidatus Riflebacteria bacterium]|nr:hypothetical protein [Candidatus Riflebacteria bacterium]
MSDSADNNKNNYTNEIKVSSNYEEFVQGILNQKKSDITFDKKLEISQKLKTNSNNQNLKKDSNISSDKKLEISQKLKTSPNNQNLKKDSNISSDKKQEINQKLKTSSNNQNLKEDKTEFEEKSSALYEAEITEFDIPQDIKVFDPQKLKFDDIFEIALTSYKEKYYLNAIPLLKELLNLNSNNLKVMSVLVTCLLEENKTREALATAQKGLEAARKELNKYYIKTFLAEIAHCFQASGDYENAVKHYKLALIHDSYDFQNNVDLINCYLKFDKIDEAFTACHNASHSYSSESEEDYLRDLNRTVEEKYYNLYPEKKCIADGEEYCRSSMYNLALRELEKALKIFPDNIRIIGKLFYVYIGLKRINDAIKTGEQFISASSEILEKYYDKSEINAELYGIYSGLAEIFKNSWHFIKAKQYKTMSDYYQLIQRGTYESVFKKYNAIETFRTAYNLKPERHEALLKLIIQLDLANKSEEAFKYLEIGISMAKSENNAARLAEYYDLEASCYGNKKQTNKEMESYDKRLAFTKTIPEKLSLYGRLININKEKKNFEKIKEYLEKSQELISNGAEDTFDLQTELIEFKAMTDDNSDYNRSKEHYRKAYYLCSQKKFTDALTEFKKAFWLLPYDLQIMEAYSECLLRQEYYKEASNIAYEGLELSVKTTNNKYAESLFNTVASYHYYQEKDFDQAGYFYEMAFRQNPHSFDCIYKAAICYKNVGNPFKAIESFKKAYELKPSEKQILDIVYEFTMILDKNSQKEVIEWLKNKKFKFPDQL